MDKGVPVTDDGGMKAPSDRMVLWRDSSLPDGLELLSASCFAYSYPAHFHDGFVVAAFSDGAQRHRVSRWSGIATRDTVMIIPPGEVHTGEAVEREHGWKYCAFYPSDRFMNAIADDVLGGQGSLEFGREIARQDPAVASLLSCANTVMARSPDILEKQSRTYAALAAVIARYGRRTRRDPVARLLRADVARAIDYLEAHYGEQVSLGDVATAVGLSEYHFMRTFKAATGLSVHRYLTQIRLKHAKACLAQGVRASEVAITVGLFDQSHLNRQFRMHFGLTPGQFAAACR
jgi:AraC-like DNA-binding protein